MERGFALHQAAHQNGHCFILILILASFILALYDEPGGKMRNPDRRFRTVDMLSAGARRAEKYRSSGLRIDIDLDRIGLRQTATVTVEVCTRPPDSVTGHAARGEHRYSY
jgi:hypothetical protein